MKVFSIDCIRQTQIQVDSEFFDFMLDNFTGYLETYDFLSFTYNELIQEFNNQNYPAPHQDKRHKDLGVLLGKLDEVDEVQFTVVPT